MKRTFKKTVICVVLVTLAFIVSSNVAWSAEKKYTMRWSNVFAQKHPVVANVYLPWIEEMKKKSNGRLEIQYFGPNVLNPTKDTYAALKSGAVDMAYMVQDANVGIFPLAGVMPLPFMFESSEAAALTAWYLFNRFPNWQKEYKAMKPLWHHASALAEISMAKKPIRTLEDIKGQRIIGWTPTTLTYIKALGAVPINISPMDTYLSIQRNMADGVVLPISPGLALKLTDLLKHHTMVHLFANVFWSGMNLRKWNSLPPDLQKLLSDTTGSKMARMTGRAMDEGDKKAIQWMKANGHNFYTLSPKELERWRSKVQLMADGWVKDMESRGNMNAREILDTAKKQGVVFQKEIDG